ncbi:MAG: glycosyltransferase [bacterium]
MDLISILLIYDEPNILNNLKNIEVIITKSKKVFFVNYGNDNLLNYSDLDIVKTGNVFNSINKIIKTYSDCNVFVLDLNIIPQTKDFLSKFDSIAKNTEYKTLLTGSLIINVEQNKRNSKIIYSCGNKLIMRGNYFTGNSKNNYGLSLNSIKTNETVEIDAVEYFYMFIPYKIISAGFLFVEVMDIYIAKSIFINDYCMQLQYKNYSILNVQNNTGLIPLNIINYDYPEKLIEIFRDFWEKKWGWDLSAPDYNIIRKKYFNKNFVKKINQNILSPLDNDAVIDILIVTLNNLPQLKSTIEKIKSSTYKKLKIYIFNNGSTDGTIEFLEKMLSTKTNLFTVVNSPVNIGLPAALNWLFSISSSPVVIRMDDDVEVEPNCFEELLKMFFRFPYAGIASPKIIIEENNECSLHYAGVYGFPTNITVDALNVIAKTKIAGGPFLMYKRKAIEKAGLWDLEFSPSQIEDIDHAYRVYKEGYDIIYNGKTRVIHKDKGKENVNIFRTNRAELMMTWFLNKHKLTDTNLFNKFEEIVEK